MGTVTLTPASGTGIPRGQSFNLTISADFAYSAHTYSNTLTVYVKKSESGGHSGYMDFNITQLPQTFTINPDSFAEGTYYYVRVTYEIWNGSYSEGGGATYPILDYSACGAPTVCSVSSTLATGDVILSWSGASAGTSNSITGYKIQRCESSDGANWGSWADLTTVSSTSTSASLTVSPPSTSGNYYKYRVLTMGSAGPSYYSGWLESSNSLRRDHAPLAGFTDDPLTAGTSPVKALHMQELQSRVSTLRTFYGLGTYNFTAITAGTTSLAGWTTHVNQIRAAIEDVCNASGKTHESWISFSVNCPRADVIQQLRIVILAL